ncbi:hypothetical protein F4777DRAFT_600248 [Nemania sp. FL0916]|nr:hypothetical protein F4777DRAFT_600248 [Nemania sp. FL0916]
MPSASSGETLAERAQRFLGLNLDTWLSEELRSDPQTVKANRSEQIAQAQRKHRQRTQSYIQALEEEVLRLRGVKLGLEGEVEKLQEQLKAKDVISQEEKSGLPLIEPQDEINGGMPTPESIVISWQGFRETGPEPPCGRRAAEDAHPEMCWTMLENEASPHQPKPTMWADAFTDAALSNTIDSLQDTGDSAAIEPVPLDIQMGVDCILRLEKPCLSHLKHATSAEPRREGYLETSYNWGLNHAYNLSTRLFNEYTVDPSSTEAHITVFDLDKLLQASERLQLANELTPVQIWSLVCKLNAVNPIDPELIISMFEALSEYSYCNRCVFQSIFRSSFVARF